MAHPISLTFGNLTHLANHLSDDTSIVVKNGGFETRGKVGSFFTRKSTNRHAGNVLFAAIRQQYGNTVADALAPRMRASREEGKPLSARTVRDILADAAEMSEGIVRINTDMARHFVLGNDGPGDPRNLDTAFNALCDDRNIPQSSRQQLKNVFGEAILKAVGKETQKILSYEELSTMVRSASLTSMKAALNKVQVEVFLNDPVQGRDAALDVCATSMGLNGPQKDGMRKVITMAAFHEAAIAAENGTPFDAQTLFQSVSTGSLTAMKNFANACGKGGTIHYVAQSIMAWATPQTAADLAMLSEQVGNLGGIAVGALAAQRLNEMRTLQPEGMLTRETLWQGCFHEPMPGQLKEATFREFNDAMFNRLSAIFQQVNPDSPSISTDGMTTLSSGLSLEKTLESLRGPVSLTLADFKNMPTLTPPSTLGSFQAVEASMAMDLKRRGSHNGLPDYMPTISFGTAGGEVSTVRIQDTSGLSEQDKQNFEKGNPSPISHSLVEHARQLCGDNDVQARQVILSMGQSGAYLVRTNSSVTGIFESEHSPLDIDIRREQNGNVTMRFFKPENSPLDIDYTYTITPDGQSLLTACRIQARQPRPAQPADA